MLTEPMLGYLKKAAPWLKFIGILGFAGSGFAVASGIFFMAVMPHLLYAQYYSGQTSSGLFYISIGIISFFPAFFTYRFGEKIKKYFKTGDDTDLEQAFKNNKLLWQVSGIFYIIFFTFIVIAVFIALFAFTYEL